MKHYQLAQQLPARWSPWIATTSTIGDFRPTSSGGVLVFRRPDERQMSSLLDRVDRTLFHAEDSDEPVAQPLVGSQAAGSTRTGRER